MKERIRTHDPGFPRHYWARYNRHGGTPSPEKLQKSRRVFRGLSTANNLTNASWTGSLLRFLSFAEVVVTGRAFLRRIFNSIARKTNSHVENHSSHAQGARSHVDGDLEAGLLWWHFFLPKWNGVRILHPKRLLFLIMVRRLRRLRNGDM